MSDNYLAMTHAEQQLALFLESPVCPAHTMGFYQLDGYLRALAISDLKPLPSDWFGLIFNDLEPSYQSEFERQSIYNQIIDRFNVHLTQIAHNLCNLPCATRYASLQAERIDLEQWARGFLQGYIVREEQWNNLLNRVTNVHTEHKISPHKFFDELDDIIAIVSVVADAEYALVQGASAEKLPAIFESLPSAIEKLARMRVELEPMSLIDSGKDVAIQLVQ